MRQTVDSPQVVQQGSTDRGRVSNNDRDSSTSGVTAPEAVNTVRKSPEIMAQELFAGDVINWNDIKDAVQSNVEVRHIIAQNPDYLLIATI